jgi:hypothetical protein
LEVIRLAAAQKILLKELCVVFRLLKERDDIDKLFMADLLALSGLSAIRLWSIQQAVNLGEQ